MLFFSFLKINPNFFCGHERQGAFGHRLDSRGMSQMSSAISDKARYTQDDSLGGISGTHPQNLCSSDTTGNKYTLVSRGGMHLQMVLENIESFTFSYVRTGKDK